MTSLTYFTVTADYLPSTDRGTLWGTVEFTMMVQSGSTLAVPSLDIISVPVTVPATLGRGVLCDSTGTPGVDLLANTPALNLSGTLYYQVTFSEVWYQAPGQQPVAVPLNSFTFAAPTSATTIDLSTVTPAAGVVAGQVASVASANITDATTLGRQLLTASSSGVALANLGIANSKLVSVADNCWGTGQGVAAATSTVGTGEMFFNIGVGVTDIRLQWNHWYTDALGVTRNDIDPSGPITFSASVRVVSSSDSTTVVGTTWRITFGGRIACTLDPGGRILSDAVGLSLAAGDVIAVRTYLSSGTAYAPTQTGGGTSGARALVPGGFTAGSDLTAPGSAAIPGSLGYYYGPANVLGYPDNANSAKSVVSLGDSISRGGGDVGIIQTVPTVAAGFLQRALSGKAGHLNIGIGGDTGQSFQGTNGSFRRISTVDGRANTAIIEYGTNDFVGGVTAAAFQAIVLAQANRLRRLGIGKVFLLTVVPRSTSTDNWATTTNQTADPNNPQRVLYNTWLRANCPIDPTTKAAVAVGTSGALLAGSFGHPITGMFDVAATVESSLNSGLWAAANRVVNDAAMTSSGFTISSATANFHSANQEAGGDKGLAFFLVGAGASGATLEGDLTGFTSTTVFQTDTVASTTVTNARLVIGPMTIEGIHPTSRGHYLMSQAINLAML